MLTQGKNVLVPLAGAGGWTGIEPAVYQTGSDTGKTEEQDKCRADPGAAATSEGERPSSRFTDRSTVLKKVQQSWNLS